MSNITTSFDWAVIGAGPAGIAAVGQLLDHQVAADKIVWIDPAFCVGDFGTKWKKVSSNTSVKLFNQFYNHCTAFDYSKSANQFKIDQLDSTSTCVLEDAAAPLQWITQHLSQKISTVKNKVECLELNNHFWQITLADQTLSIKSKNVILALGSEPKSLKFDNIVEIPLVTALNPAQLTQQCNAEDTIAVFGSSHSAIIIIQSLLEQTSVKKVINFYQDPLRYAVYFEDWILFDDTGLKGNTAKWARQHLHGEMPTRLTRVISDANSISQYLPECTKAIYPIGFARRTIPISGMRELKYNEHNGIIAPGLFGVGIAFPEAAVDRYGNLEYRVGLWKFMDYLSRIMPVWLRYGI